MHTTPPVQAVVNSVQFLVGKNSEYFGRAPRASRHRAALLTLAILAHMVDHHRHAVCCMCLIERGGCPQRSIVGTYCIPGSKKINKKNEEMMRQSETTFCCKTVICHPTKRNNLGWPFDSNKGNDPRSDIDIISYLRPRHNI